EQHGPFPPFKLSYRWHTARRGFSKFGPSSVPAAHLTRCRGVPRFGITAYRFRWDGCRSRHIMKNGLYSIHVSLQDGRSGKGSGVIMFQDGKILGGDAYLFYTGSYMT